VNSPDQKIRNFVFEKFPLARRYGLQDSDLLLEKGVIDSLGILDLVTFLEKEFSISVLDDELGPEHFRSIESLASFVEYKRSGAPSH